MPAFSVTLGGLLMYRGGAFSLSSGRTVAPLSERFSGAGQRPQRRHWRTLELGLGLGLLGMAVVFTDAGNFIKRQRRGLPNRPLLQVLATGVSLLFIYGFIRVMNGDLDPRTDLPRGRSVRGS